MKKFNCDLYKRHGMSNSRLHRIWRHLKDRCLNKNNDAYKNYGGRGVYICKEWENSFLDFYNWSIKNGYKENLTIDRIDVNGNYCPENCRWATQKEQQQNRRDNKKIVTERGEMCLSEFSRKTGIKFNKVCKWFDRGMTADEIMSIASSFYRGKKIFCETNNKTYNNASEFLDDIGKKHTGRIYDVLNGKSKKNEIYGYKIIRI